MNVTVLYLIKIAVLLVALLFSVFVIAALRWMRLDAQYKRQRMLKDRAYVYTKTAERIFKADAYDAKAAYVGERIRDPYDADEVTEAALYDVLKRTTRTGGST